MLILKQFTTLTEYGGEYEVQLEDWGEDERPRYRVTVGYEDGGTGRTNYLYDFEYEDLDKATESFIQRVQ